MPQYRLDCCHHFHQNVPLPPMPRATKRNDRYDCYDRYMPNQSNVRGPTVRMMRNLGFRSTFSLV
jgi:hypothetical protein